MTRRLVLIIVVAVVVLGVGSFGLGYYARDLFESPGPLTGEARVIVERGDGLSTIADNLSEAGVIRDAFAFMMGARLLGKAHDLKAGEYVFPAGVSMREALATIESGRTVVRRVTLAEGLTSAEIVALVASAEGLTGEIETAPPEGTLLPETYHYAWQDHRADLVHRMAAAQEALVAELWPQRDPSLPITSPEEALILASIVEKETGVAEERPLVASVFVNRINKGMRLQSDPTVAYGLSSDGLPLGRPLTRKDLDTPNPYNTYLIDGLPPGPIANPGRASLEAVLNPATSNYLYFVADGTGGHAFAETLAEHNRNVAKWRKIQKQNKAGN